MHIHTHKARFRLHWITDTLVHHNHKCRKIGLLNKLWLSALGKKTRHFNSGQVCCKTPRFRWIPSGCQAIHPVWSYKRVGCFGMIWDDAFQPDLYEKTWEQKVWCGWMWCSSSKSNSRSWEELGSPHPICRSGAGCFQWLQPQIAHDEARFACSVLTDWGPQNFAEKKLVPIPCMKIDPTKKNTFLLKFTTGFIIFIFHHGVRWPTGAAIMPSDGLFLPCKPSLLQISLNKTLMFTSGGQLTV